MEGILGGAARGYFPGPGQLEEPSPGSMLGSWLPTDGKPLVK